MPTMIAFNNSLKGIDVIILGGGQGTRLRDVVKDRPKPMADINGRPFLDILINYISNFGFRRFILSIGYLAEVIEKYYQTNNALYEVVFSKENEPLGTGGAVKNAEKYIRSNPFLVLNGDSFCPVDLNNFFCFHLAKEALCSMVIADTENVGAGGGVTVDDSQKIVGFGEKQQQGKGHISAGIYLFEKKVLSLIPAGTNHSLEYDLFPALAGRKFYGYKTNEKMIDIGTPERYFKANEFFRNLNIDI